MFEKWLIINVLSYLLDSRINRSTSPEKRAVEWSIEKTIENSPSTGIKRSSHWLFQLLIFHLILQFKLLVIISQIINNLVHLKSLFQYFLFFLDAVGCERRRDSWRGRHGKVAWRTNGRPRPRCRQRTAGATARSAHGSRGESSTQYSHAWRRGPSLLEYQVTHSGPWTGKLAFHPFDLKKLSKTMEPLFPFCDINNSFLVWCCGFKRTCMQHSRYSKFSLRVLKLNRRIRHLGSHLEMSAAWKFYRIDIFQNLSTRCSNKWGFQFRCLIKNYFYSFYRSQPSWNMYVTNHLTKVDVNCRMRMWIK